MRARLLTLCACCALISGCDRHDSASRSKSDIKAVFDRWRTAFEAKDVNGVMSIYAPGTALVAYDVVPPLQYKGTDAYRKDYTDFFAQFKGPLRVEVPNMQIVAGKDVAIAFGLERLTGTLNDGTPVDMWLRYTEGLKRIDGHWRVVHEHISVPVDLSNGKAALDLKP